MKFLYALFMGVKLLPQMAYQKNGARELNLKKLEDILCAFTVSRRIQCYLSYIMFFLQSVVAICIFLIQIKIIVILNHILQDSYGLGNIHNLRLHKHQYFLRKNSSFVIMRYTCWVLPHKNTDIVAESAGTACYHILYY